MTFGSFVVILVLAGTFTATGTEVAPNPTPAPSTATVAPAPASDQPDGAKFAEYISDIKLGVLPLAAKPGDALLPTTTFAMGDQICHMSTVIKPCPWADGIYDTQAKSYVQPKRSYSGTALGPIVGCGFPQLPTGKYEFRVWVGETLVAAVPFEVR